MKRYFQVFVGTLFLLTAFSPAQDILGDPVGRLPDTRSAVIALTGGTVHVGNGQVLEGATVVVADGLIQAVGTNISIPANAWRIDAAGTHVYPGLIDTMTEVGLRREPGSGEGRQPAPAQFRFGGGPPAPANPEGPGLFAHVAAADMIENNAEQLAPWRSSGILALNVAPDEGIFRGQTAVVSLSPNGTGTDMVVSTPTALSMSLGGIRGSYPGSLMGVLAHIRQTLLDAKHYQLAHDIYARNPSGLKRPSHNRALAALKPVLERQIPVIIPANREREISRALAIAAEHQIRVIVAGGFEADRSLDELKATKTPVLVSLSFPEAPRNRHPEAEDTLRTLEYRENAPTIPAKLASAGVEFAFYSDQTRTGTDFIGAIRTAIENGLDSETALQAASLSAAQILGVDRQLGSVETGKIANLVVAGGDLFAEDTHIRHVIVDGDKLDLPPPTENSRGQGRQQRPAGNEMPESDHQEYPR